MFHLNVPPVVSDIKIFLLQLQRAKNPNNVIGFLRKPLKMQSNLWAGSISIVYPGGEHHNGSRLS